MTRKEHYINAKTITIARVGYTKVMKHISTYENYSNEVYYVGYVPRANIFYSMKWFSIEVKENCTIS